MNAILKSHMVETGDEHHYAVYGNEVICMSGTEPSQRHFEAELLIRSKANSGYIVAPRNQVFLVSTMRESSMRVAGTAAAAIVERVKSKRNAPAVAAPAPVTKFAALPTSTLAHGFFVPLTIDYVCTWAKKNGVAITPMSAERALVLLKLRFEQGYDFGYDALARCIKDASLQKQPLKAV